MVDVLVMAADQSGSPSSPSGEPVVPWTDGGFGGPPLRRRDPFAALTTAPKARWSGLLRPTGRRRPRQTFVDMGKRTQTG